MTTPPIGHAHTPTAGELALLRRSLTLQSWMHQRQRTDPPARVCRTPNLGLSNLCESGRHERCWDAFEGQPERHALTCGCLCHQASYADWAVCDIDRPLPEREALVQQVRRLRGEPTADWAALPEPCHWCHGTGRPTHPGDLGDAGGTACSRCEGLGNEPAAAPCRHGHTGPYQGCTCYAVPARPLPAAGDELDTRAAWGDQ